MGDRWFLFLGEDEIGAENYHTPTKLMTDFQEHDKYLEKQWASEAYAANAGTLPEVDADVINWHEGSPHDYEGSSECPGTRRAPPAMT